MIPGPNIKLRHVSQKEENIAIIGQPAKEEEKINPARKWLTEDQRRQSTGKKLKSQILLD